MDSHLKDAAELQQPTVALTTSFCKRFPLTETTLLDNAITVGFLLSPAHILSELTDPPSLAPIWHRVVKLIPNSCPCLTASVYGQVFACWPSDVLWRTGHFCPQCPCAPTHPQSAPGVEKLPRAAAAPQRPGSSSPRCT